MKRTILIFLILLAFCVLTYFAQAQEETPVPEKAEIDTNYDGLIDRIEYYNKYGGLIRIETDANYNGEIDEWVYYENGKVARAEKDTNDDGKPDTWVTYY